MIEFFTKVAGVTFNNIQQYLPNIKVEDKLDAIREPENLYDSNAIALLHNGNKIGYFPKNLAAELKSYNIISVNVSAITGGNNKAYGCNIFVQAE